MQIYIYIITDKLPQLMLVKYIISAMLATVGHPYPHEKTKEAFYCSYYEFHI